MATPTNYSRTWLNTSLTKLTAEQEWELMDIMTDPTLSAQERFRRAANLRFGLDRRANLKVANR